MATDTPLRPSRAGSRAGPLGGTQPRDGLAEVGNLLNVK